MHTNLEIGVTPSVDMDPRMHIGSRRDNHFIPQLPYFI
jgi:hypothetical protein